MPRIPHKTLYSKHMKTISDLPTDAAVIKAKMDLDKKYPTEEVKEVSSKEETVVNTTVNQPVVEDIPAKVETTVHTESKFDNLKFGDNYDVEAE